MTQLSKVVLVLAGAAFVIWALLVFSLNSRLDEAITRLESAQSRIDSSLWALTVARTTIDSVRGDLSRFSTYIRDIQGRVEILDLKDRAGNSQFRSQKESILRRLQDLYRDIQTTGNALPEIPVIRRRG